MHTANERRHYIVMSAHYIVMSALIGWAHTQDDLCSTPLFFIITGDIQDNWNDTLQCLQWPYVKTVVMAWKHSPQYWPFVRGIHWLWWSSPHKGPLKTCHLYFHCWTNSPVTGNLRCQDIHVRSALKLHNSQCNGNPIPASNNAVVCCRGTYFDPFSCALTLSSIGYQ